MKTGTKIGIGLAILLVVGLGVFVLMRSFGGDDLDPEVAQLLAKSPPQIAAADNAYFAWIGVVGPESETAHSWGRRWFEQALAADRQGPADDQAKPALAIEGEERGESFAADALFCDKPASCLDDVAADPAAARALLARAATTLGRIDGAFAFPAYQEAWRPDLNYQSGVAPQPAYARQLLATRFALAVAEHRDDEALERLDRQISFHVRQMQGTVTLIGKLIAIAGLRNDYQLLNRYLFERPVAAARRAERLAGMLAPLNGDSLRMDTVFATECRTAIRLFLSLGDEFHRSRRKGGDALPFRLPDPAAGWFGFLYQPGATANEQYRSCRVVLDADGKSGDDYRQALAAIRQHSDQAGEFGLADVMAGNPIGQMLVRIGTADYAPYFLRRDDLVVLRAAVALQLDLLRQGVGDENTIRRAIRAADLVHPFTGETPTWDGEQHTLTYEAQPGRKDQPLVIAF